MSELLSSAEHFGFVLSIFIFLMAVQITLRFKLELFNPLLISTIIIIVILTAFNIPYSQYREGADLLNYFLTPATVCLAIPLYKQFSLLKNNFKAVFCAVFLGTVCSIVSILLMGFFFQLSKEHISTLLPKSITTAIGMGVSESMGGYVNLTVAAIVLTGISGGILSNLVFKIFPASHSKRPCFGNRCPCDWNRQGLGNGRNRRGHVFLGNRTGRNPYSYSGSDSTFRNLLTCKKKVADFPFRFDKLRKEKSLLCEKNTTN